MERLLRQFKSENVFKYGIAAVLLAIPLYPKFPVFNIPGTYVAIRAEDFLIGSLGVYWFFWLLRKPRLKLLLKDKLAQAILLFWGVGLLSIVSAVLLTQTVSPHIAFLHWIRRVEYMLVFFIAATAVGKTKRIRFFIETLFIAVVFVFIYGVGQRYLHWPVISTQNFEYAKGLALRLQPWSRLHSTFSGHYDLAAFLVMTFPMVWAFLFSYKKWITRFVAGLLIIPSSFWLLVKTESRISFVAYLVAVFVTLWFLKKRVLIVPVLLLSVTIALLFSGIGERYRYSLETYWQKVRDSKKINLVSQVYAQETINIHSLEDVNLDRKPSPPGEDRSTAIRLNVEWPRALRAFYKNPLLGTGYSSITLATDNDYLRLLGETGVVGALAFLLVLLRLFDRVCWFFRKPAKSLQYALAAGFLGGFVGIGVNAVFIDVFEASKVAIIFWTLAGLAVGVADLAKEKR